MIKFLNSIGRTGRVGNSGIAISFYNPNDDSLLAPKLVKSLIEAKQEIPPFLKEFKGENTIGNGGMELDDRRVSFSIFYVSILILIKFSLPLPIEQHGKQYEF